jgi:hypothetical protein
MSSALAISRYWSSARPSDRRQHREDLFLVVDLSTSLVLADVTDDLIAAT